MNDFYTWLKEIEPGRENPDNSVLGNQSESVKLPEVINIYT